MDIKYENRLVAFVDVLGFSNLVYSRTTELISKYFSFVIGDFRDAIKKHGFKFLVISDSIVLSAPDTKENLRTAVKVLYRLQQKLLEEEGILVRGGISHGELYLSEDHNIIVGPGLINAYKLESQAIYPRIILDRSFIPKYYAGTAELITDLVWVRYEQRGNYRSDFIYLDYCRGIGFTDQRKKFARVLLAMQDSFYLNEHIEKYEWLRVHIEDSVGATFQYLDEKPDKSKHEKLRLRMIKEFLSGMAKL